MGSWVGPRTFLDALERSLVPARNHMPFLGCPSSNLVTVMTMTDSCPLSKYICSS